MKNLESLAKGNALVAVVNKGETTEVVVADAKHIAWVIAALVINPDTLQRENEVRLVAAKPSVYKKVSKITNDPLNPVVFAADSEELKPIAELAANEEELFDVEAILATYTGKIRVFVVEKDGQFGLVKANFGIKSILEGNLKEAGYNVVATGIIEGPAVLPFAPLRRVAGKKAELIVYPVSAEVKDYVVAMFPKEEAPAEEAEVPAEQPVDVEAAE